jgi:hypothetical protein
MKHMMIITAAALAAWALASVPIGILIGSMWRTGRDREFDRRPLDGPAGDRVLAVL